MKLLLFFALLTILFCCSGPSKNVLLSEFDTPYQAPPFDKIGPAFYGPAYQKALAEHDAELAQITDNPAAPTFENTVAALDRSGVLLDRVRNIFSNMNSAMTDDRMQKIAKDMAPVLSKHKDDILMNAKLFARIKTVFDQKESLELDTEQSKLLEEYYKDFVRGGANLPAEQKEKLQKLNKEISVLTVQFGENLLKDKNAFELVITDQKDLAGLPDGVIQAAAEAGGHDGKWVFTLDKPSLIPFLQYSEKRPLREKMFKAYINQGDNDNEYDNKSVLKKIADLRIQRAQLLGYQTHADYVLEENMAKEPANVYRLLEQLWQPALEKAEEEAAALQDMIVAGGETFKLEPWDWWYYTEKLRKQKYDLDDAVLRPYFKLENVRDGAFEVANKLFGISFREITNVPVYHPEVRVFEVTESDGSLVGLLYTDYFPRPSKRGGAWMSSYRKQWKLDGENITPHIVNVCNFTKPAGDKPALLSFDEVETLFHEFGHALHGLLSDCTYRSLSGTAVPRDFVELPSQIMENWVAQPRVLRSFAKHYQTGEPIPPELVEKIVASGKFNQGFKTVEYLAASFLDMDWHTLTEPPDMGVNEFEKRSMEKINLLSEIVSRYRSTYFRHIFTSGYSSGYYSYIWAEVLDADAFEAFKENGLFDRETATAYRDNILAKGGSRDPMVLYKSFRGSEPEIGPLLRNRGLN